MRLFLAGSSYQPLVVFDLGQSFLRIDGMSNMPNAAEFYQSIIQWLVQHREAISEGTELVLRLLYLNSSPNKALYHFFLQIGQARLPITIVLILSRTSDNEDVVLLLQQICRLVGIPHTIREESGERGPFSS